MIDSQDTSDSQDVIELDYRPTRADILTGVLARERLRPLFGAAAALLAVAAVRTSAVPAVLAAFCAVLIWSTPRLQAHHALRTVDWQGEYHSSVSGAGLTAETAHVSLRQRWSVFRGYRETRDHFVLFSRDPNVLLVEVLPLRGLRSPEEAERLRALLDRRLPRL
ncbi:YcxB family protein [Streptomyces sp. SS]|uniref:YcxB family protein n=1 Tax=Streptomyces sp. SS TaxID=260742 RepID=UPI00030ACD52|nr:YcxB family protein [Streptomyces sp. SS]